MPRLFTPINLRLTDELRRSHSSNQSSNHPRRRVEVSVQTAKVKAVDTAAAAGAQDLVVLAVKAYSLEQIAKDTQCLLDPETMIMTVQNGIPWWYFQKHGGDLDGTCLQSLDPSGRSLRTSMSIASFRA